MKLFKSLLVAPATLGLLAPIAATANEVTISDFTPAEQLAITNSRVDGLEARMNDMEAGSFSETTTATFGVDFYLGSTDDEEATAVADDALTFAYSLGIGLNTSFTGEDSLDIAIDAGNSTEGVIEFDGNTNGDGLTVDGVSYTFPVGDATVIVGDSVDGSALFTTACAYGGPGNMLDDCGNANAGITQAGITAATAETMVGASYDFGNGFTAATGFQTSNTTAGVFTDESRDAYALNAAYTADVYAVSITYGVIENAGLTNENKYTAFNAYYTPDMEGFPSLSVGYELGDLGGAAAVEDEQTSFFVGLTWDEVGPGSAGIAAGHSNTVEDTDEAYQYEAYYSYPINDGMTITPLIFTRDNVADGLDDTTGVMVKTSFSF